MRRFIINFSQYFQTSNKKKSSPKALQKIDATRRQGVLNK